MDEKFWDENEPEPFEEKPKKSSDRIDADDFEVDEEDGWN